MKSIKIMMSVIAAVLMLMPTTMAQPVDPSTHTQTGDPTYATLWACAVLVCTGFTEDTTDAVSASSPEYLVAAVLLNPATASACPDGVVRPNLCGNDAQDNLYFVARGAVAGVDPDGTGNNLCIVQDGNPNDAPDSTNADNPTETTPNLTMTYSVWNNVPLSQSGPMFANGNNLGGEGPYFTSDFSVLGGGTHVNVVVSWDAAGDSVTCESWFDANGDDLLDRPSEAVNVTLTGGSDWVQYDLA